MTAPQSSYPVDTDRPAPDELAALRERYAEQLDARNVPYLDTPRQSAVRALADHAMAKAAGRLDVVAAPKAYANAVARAALQGFELWLMEDGGFIASKWGYSAHLATMDEVETWLKRVGA